MSTYGTHSALGTLENDLALACKQCFSSLCPCSDPQCLPKRNANLCSHTKHLIFNPWQEPKCPWIDEWLTNCRHHCNACPQSNWTQVRADTPNNMEDCSARGWVEEAWKGCMLYSSDRAKPCLKKSHQYLRASSGGRGDSGARRHCVLDVSSHLIINVKQKWALEGWVLQPWHLETDRPHLLTEGLQPQPCFLLLFS